MDGLYKIHKYIMSETTATIGRIVEFFPNKNGSGLQLPNNMESAPAMVVQVFGSLVNLNVFTADTNGQPVQQAWSVEHKSKVVGESFSWDWLPRV